MISNHLFEIQSFFPAAISGPLKRGACAPRSVIPSVGGLLQRGRHLPASGRAELLGRRLGDRLVDLDIVDRVRQGCLGPANGVRLSQDITLSPDRVDADTTRARNLELAPQLADEHVDDLRLRLVHAAIEMAQEGGLAEDRSLAQRQEFDDAELLAGQWQRLALDQRQMTVQVDLEVAGRHRRGVVSVGAPDDGVQIGKKLEPVERLGQVTVGTRAKRSNEWR